MTPMSKLLTACVMGLTIGGELAANAATLPQLPQKAVDVTMPTVNGSTLNATCATLQAQLNAAAALDVNLTHQIILATGYTCTGPFILPSHTGGTGWILIKGANYASLPPSGTRVGLNDRALMPQIKYGESGTTNGAIAAVTGAQRYRIIGIEMVQDSTIAQNYVLLTMGYNSWNATNTGYIIVDRSILHDTDPAHSTTRGVYGNADLGNTALIDSYVAGIKTVGQESQAWLSLSNAGPILIQNNFLEAAGENVMFCGGLPASQALQPQDITVRLNTFQVNGAWQQQGGGFVVKSLLEFKCGLRSLVEGNTFTQMAYDGGGNAFRLTPRSELAPGTGGWMEVSDLTIRYNLINNVTNWINSIASDDGGNGPGFITQRSKRWSLHDNLVSSLGFLCGGGSTCGAPFSAQFGGITNGCGDPNPTCQFSDISFFHNTIDGMGQWVMQINQPGNQNLDFRDNLINVNNAYGYFDGNAVQWGTNALNLDWGLTWNWANNSLAGIGSGDSSSSYPQGTNSYPASATTFQWNNPAGGDYTLQAGSPAKNAASDGTDQGVNFTAYNAARAGGGGGSLVAPPTPQNIIIHVR